MNIFSKSKKANNKAFTLIELLVVIAIISLLSSVVMVAVSSARQKAQISKVRSELGEFVKALEIYRTSYGKYPSSTGCNFTSIAQDVCYSDGGNQTEFETNILSNTEFKKIYSGNLINSLKSIPKFQSLIIIYTSTPAGIVNLRDGVGLSPVCNNKKALTGSDEYYLLFQVRDSPNGNFIIGLDGTYLGKEYENGSLDGNYCSPNN